MNNMIIMHGKERMKEILRESANLKQSIAANEDLIANITKAAELLAQVLKEGGKILICGNGGSASDALHFCGEIVGRFKKERHAAPAIALNADVATMTAVANDYGYDTIFERGVDAFMKSEDIFIGISTSGNSDNVYKAIVKANEIGGKTIALLGKNGGKISKEANISIVVPSDDTARIQEAHICIIHGLCELVENTLV